MARKGWYYEQYISQQMEVTSWKKKSWKKVNS
jgi:hypothetical protein